MCLRANILPNISVLWATADSSGLEGGMCVWAGTAAPLPRGEEVTTPSDTNATEMLNVLHVEVPRKWKAMGIFSKNYLPFVAQF